VLSLKGEDSAERGSDTMVGPSSQGKEVGRTRSIEENSFHMQHDWIQRKI
jgi:hypothetical protein